MSSSQCKGLWGGRVDLGLPLSCSIIHVILGILALWWPWIAPVFVVYQLTQHYVERKPFDKKSATTDIAEFILGMAIAKLFIAH